MKRMDNEYIYNKSKRIKLQEVDDVWGDDPAIEEVDRCINLATQICSQTQTERPSNIQDANYTVVNYDCFKQKSNLVASTQAVENTTFVNKIQSLENEKKKFMEENETKKGEIAFLRAQLKQSQNLVSKEKLERLKILQQTQETWNEKLNMKNKEVASLKCENELKTLEAANLRQKLTELKKMYNCNISIWSDDQNKTLAPQASTSKNKNCESVQTVDNLVVYSYKNIFYPYKELLVHFEENFETRLNKFSENNKYNMPNDIIHFILKVANYTDEEINNSDDFLEFIIKLEKYIRDYLIYVLIKLVKSNDTNESNINKKNCSNLYLNANEVENNFGNIYGAVPWSEFELEIDLRRLIAIVAYLCQHSLIFYNLLRKQLNNHYDLNDFENIDNNMERLKTLDFLQTILQITIYVKNCCLTEQLCGFLASTLKLLTAFIDRAILPENCYNLIFEIFKQILYAQPNEPVLQYICYFLKYISEHGHFMSMLCTRKKSNHTQIKEGLLYFSDETCTLKILASIIETCKIQIDSACNLMHFLQNLVTCNVYWMYHQNQQSCGCLGDIYGLAITILYKSLEKFTTLCYKEQFLCIFHAGLLFLHVLTVRIPDLVAKCSRLYSQYQTIIKYMYQMRHELLLTNAHETMLDNLISQLNCDIQNNEIKKSSVNMNNVMNDSYNCNFIKF